ncbi:hypothetical protein COU87_00515 [Candidatus Roizmanbacteria bacterium CG10_big_fil_rev_8_21_14_0_10_39_12]|uniref:Uncharacterized protein n=1 Tax=Candidatus Roizmanbacteria bacterium CG10_big_fil_rev_8_21_14_0_10_39_12 TaxID=1974852 RepID=A0A2M8KQN1_9BACT|nr:MAG: hypothetical protein COU87_00515 [Candidatus Roizmanbacteria bacterium CG10_big_fil_rev_8_21_14_0_10_39_12]
MPKNLGKFGALAIALALLVVLALGLEQVARADLWLPIVAAECATPTSTPTFALGATDTPLPKPKVQMLDQKTVQMVLDGGIPAVQGRLAGEEFATFNIRDHWGYSDSFQKMMNASPTQQIEFQINYADGTSEHRSWNVNQTPRDELFQRTGTMDTETMLSTGGKLESAWNGAVCANGPMLVMARSADGTSFPTIANFVGAPIHYKYITDPYSTWRVLNPGSQEGWRVWETAGEILIKLSPDSQDVCATFSWDWTYGGNLTPMPTVTPSPTSTSTSTPTLTPTPTPTATQDHYWSRFNWSLPGQTRFSVSSGPSQKVRVIATSREGVAVSQVITATGSPYTIVFDRTELPTEPSILEVVPANGAYSTSSWDYEVCARGPMFTLSRTGGKTYPWFHNYTNLKVNIRVEGSPDWLELEVGGIATWIFTDVAGSIEVKLKPSEEAPLCADLSWDWNYMPPATWREFLPFIAK